MLCSISVNFCKFFYPNSDFNNNKTQTYKQDYRKIIEDIVLNYCFLPLIVFANHIVTHKFEMAYNLLQF